jgi:hypothetical protein
VDMARIDTKAKTLNQIIEGSFYRTIPEFLNEGRSA